MKRKLKNYIKSNSGAAGSIDFIFIMMGVFLFIFLFVSTAPVYFKYQDLAQMTNSVVRATEGTGEINSEINQLIGQYKTDLKLSPTVQWDGNINSNGHIQINEDFYLTLTDKYEIVVAEPTFTKSKSITITIPLSKKVRGVSGVYWKPDVY